MFAKGAPKKTDRILHSASFVKRLVVGVLLINLFVIVLSSWSLYQSRNQYDERAAVTTQNLVQVLEQNIASIIEQADLALIAVTDEFDRHARAGALKEPVLDRFLAQQLSHHPHLTSLRITDAQGMVICGPGVAKSSRTNNGDRDYFTIQRDHPQAGLVITKPVFARISKKWVITISRRLNWGEGSFAGVVYANIALDDIYKIISSVDVGRHGLIALRDRDMGRIVSHPDDKAIGSSIGERGVSRELQRLVAAGQASATYYTPTSADNIARTVSYRMIDKRQIYIIVGLAEKEYLAAWRKEVIIMVSAITLITSMSFLFVLMLTRDITERKQAEAMVFKKEKLLAVHGLAFGMAHEINNPLHIISQAVQNIERRISPQLSANQKVAEELGISLEQVQAYFEQRQIFQFITSICDAATRAGKILTNILQFASSAPTTMQPVAPVNVLERVLEIAANDDALNSRFNFKQIEIVRDYAPHIVPIPMSAVEIEQVLLNLLTNAIQAVAANPPERKACIVLRVSQDAQYTLIEVEDNGAGIAEEERQRVFEPFFTTREVGQGPGLGLSIAYIIVTQHHKGELDVEAVPGNGTRFTVRLPFDKRASR